VRVVIQRRRHRISDFVRSIGLDFQSQFTRSLLSPVTSVCIEQTALFHSRKEIIPKAKKLFA
jgi:hypothetical protein